MLQTRICANSILATPFVWLAVIVVMAFQLVAFLARLTLVTLRAQADRAMIRDAAERVYTARRTVSGARILALAVRARQGRRTVGMSAAADQT